jgi:hypothetical protein
MTSKRKLKKKLKRGSKKAVQTAKAVALTPIESILSKRLKTLIVFDTNSLRSTDAGEVVYSSFSFGKAYDVINGFIMENKLQNDVSVAVSALVVDEIKIQMERSYKSDLQRLGDTKRRMNGLPHVSAELIGIPDNDFDCSEYVELKANNYLENNKHVKLLNFSKDQSEQILKSLITRAHKTKPPFFKTAKNSDAGFKDSVIWETLLNYKGVEKYHKVILVTKDEGFKGCEIEFAGKWNRHFKIIAIPEAVNTELGVDYNNYIKERAIHDFAQTEYFVDYLKEELNAMTVIVSEGREYRIENYTITDICKNVNRLPPNEDEIENLLISTEINIHFTQDAEKKAQTIKATTTLEDDETKEIISTEYDIELK